MQTTAMAMTGASAPFRSLDSHCTACCTLRSLRTNYGQAFSLPPGCRSSRMAIVCAMMLQFAALQNVLPGAIAERALRQCT